MYKSEVKFVLAKSRAGSWGSIRGTLSLNFTPLIGIPMSLPLVYCKKKEQISLFYFRFVPSKPNTESLSTIRLVILLPSG